jgi:simple sugar transport system substrate-binding protein
MRSKWMTGLVVGLMLALTLSIAGLATTKVGLILVGSIHDQGWSQTHYENMLAAAGSFGGEVEVIVQEEVLDPMFPEIARDMILSDGVDIIFAASATYQGFITVLADEFQEVMWEFTDPTVVEPKPNVRGYYVRFYEGNFLAGVAVGRLLKQSGMALDGKSIGMVSSIPFPLTIRNVNAAIAGVRYGLGSDIPGKVTWLGSVSENPWYNPEQEALLARTLIDGGAIALNSYLDSTAVIEVAEEQGVLSWGITRDNTPFGPTTNVANSIVDWTAYYTDRIQRLIDGTWDAGSTWAHMRGTPTIELGPLAGFLTLDIAREIWDLQDKIATGEFVVLPELTESELLTSVDYLPGVED